MASTTPDAAAATIAELPPVAAPAPAAPVAAPASPAPASPAPAPPSQEERNAEIWQTRIQQELLALTTDNADMESLTEARSTLPPFTSIQEHSLDLAKGTCILTVQVEVTVPKEKPTSPKEEGEEATNDETTTNDNNTKSVIVLVEASLNSDKTGPSYPFVPPVTRLKKGKDSFPEGSTIEHGDIIGMDLDWTPSLHLTDAIMNIGLKLKETILQSEPFHPEPPQPSDKIAQEVDEVVKGARRFASKLGQTASSFGKKAFSSPKGMATPKKMRGANNNKKKSPPPRKAPQTPGDVKIGDEINLLEKPWEDAHGVYTCKAIRRPPFVEEIIQKSKKEEQQKMTSPSAMMFRSFAQSARSVMEESFIMVTDTHIIELRASKLNMQIGHVAFCIPIEQMAKLKFRREESLSLFFKASPDDPLIYMCPDSGDAVHQIQTVLKGKGVRGKHTNAAAYRAIHEALGMVSKIQTKEMALEHEPTVERVNEIMDLYRQAAERFEIAGDVRHEEVVTHMRKFLAKPITNQILDGSHKKQPASGAVPEGEVLDRAHTDSSDHYDEEEHADPTLSAASDKAFVENIDSLLKDAKEDFEEFNLGDDNEDAADLDMDMDGEESGLEDMAADLDAMMKEADKELAELMSS